MNIISSLLSKYPADQVTPQDFIDKLTIGNPGWQSAYLAVLLTVIFGLLVYIIPIYLTEKDHQGLYPLYMHTFYCAADFMGIWVFLDTWSKNGHVVLFLLLAIGEAIWVLMEIYSLQRALTYEKDINWKPGTSFKTRLRDVIFQVLIFYVSLNLLRFELHDSTMWKFWIFTQILITTVPGLSLERQGSRQGHNVWLHVTLICVVIASFNPWCNMWAIVAPKLFSPANNPWYYITGAVCLFFAVHGLIVYLKLPAKK
ncbi:ABC transporter permease [Lactobacillus delbrueckii]|uniref:ABC transporter permease n=1 Tax=Lactobacillus delbrueckii TaxID=1584 RepID=UPI002364A24B|nr:ABC transporter permease [Lactobacillus delbrueckii]MDD1332954.1 ABC transporter permease [Lactobacillus delbrueckii subsp. lactis]